MLSIGWEQRRAVRRLARTDGFLKKLEETTSDSSLRQKQVTALGSRARRQRTDLKVLAGNSFGWKSGVVIAWSGMRGVVTLAAAQSLPLDVPFRAQLILIAFTVALTTLVFYGATLPLLIRALGISGPDEAERMKEVQSLVNTVVAAGADRMRSEDLRRPNGETFDTQLVTAMIEGRAEVAKEFWELRLTGPSEAIGQRAILFDEMLRAEQAALNHARSSGLYSAEALSLTQSVLDIEQARTV